MLFSRHSLICSRNPLFSTIIIRISQDSQRPSQLAETHNFHSLIFFVSFSDYHEGFFSSVLRKNLIFLILPQNRFQNTKARNYTSSRGKKKIFWLNILQARKREMRCITSWSSALLGFFNVSHSYITSWSVRTARQGLKFMSKISSRGIFWWVWPSSIHIRSPLWKNSSCSVRTMGFRTPEGCPVLKYSRAVASLLKCLCELQK